MKKILFFLMMFTLSCLPWATRAQNAQFTLFEYETGNNANWSCPVWGYNLNYGDCATEFIIPTRYLDFAEGATFTKMRFYIHDFYFPENAASVNWNVPYRVYLSETETYSFRTVSDTIGRANATLVFSGILNGDKSNRILDVVFDTPYQYHGGNLVVGFWQNGSSSVYAGQGGCAFITTSVEDTVYWVGYTDYDHYDFSVGTMIPKITFDYYGISCLKPRDLQVYYYVPGSTTAQISWVSDASDFEIEINGVVYNFNDASPNSEHYYDINVVSGTEYTVKVKAHCNAQEESEWSRPLVFLTAPQCEVTLELSSNSIYGWDFDSIEVWDNTNNLSLGTFKHRGTNPWNLEKETYTVAVSEGQDISFRFPNGYLMYPQQCSWIIIAPTGDTIAQKDHQDDFTGRVIANYTASCSACYITVELNDPDGDNWNGNAIGIMDNGEFLTSITPDYNEPIRVFNGHYIGFTWMDGYSGNYNSHLDQYSWTIRDAGGNIITQGSDASNLTDGDWIDDYTVDCSAQAPAVPSQCNITFDLVDSWGDGWNYNTIEVRDASTGELIATMFNENMDGTSGSGQNEHNVTPLTVDNGREIVLLWVFDEQNRCCPGECSWVITAPNGEVISEVAADSASSFETGRELATYTVNCAHAPTPTPSNYCVPAPTTVDGEGIVNVSFGTGNNIVNNSTHPTSAPYYGDYSSQIGAVAAGTTATVAITYNTCGYSSCYNYGTLIWVDWNNDGTFGDNEIVFTGQSSTSNPTGVHTLNASFAVSANQATGDYRMRIGAADSYFDGYIQSSQGNHDPCYSGENANWAVFHDYTLRVTETPSCLPPVVTVDYWTSTTANISWTDNNNGTPTYIVKMGNEVLSGSTTPAVSINGTSATLTGLTAEHNYAAGDFTVTANCNGNDFSDAANVPAFYTGYCVPAPVSVDVEGITNVSFGTGNNIVNNSTHPTSAPYYGDYTSQIGAVIVGQTATVDITFNTCGNRCFNYGTIIWVDWNNNQAFEDNEIVFTALSSQEENPAGVHTLNATFAVSPNQATGDYRMRIGAADSYFNSYITNGSGPHDPCYSGSFAVFHDYTLRVTEATTCPPLLSLEATAQNPHTITAAWSPDQTIEPEGYVVRYGIVDDPEQYLHGVTPDGQTCVINNLCSDSLYYIHVRAYCGGNDYSEWTTVSQRTLAGSCSPITNLHVDLTGNGTNSATISWTASESTTADLYDIHVCTAPVRDLSTLENGNCEFPQATRGTSFSIPNNNYPNFVLTPNTTYYVYVRTRCNLNDGNSDWAETTFSTLPPCRQPMNASVHLIRKMLAEISWERGDTNQADNYMLIFADQEMSEQALENAQAHVSNIHDTTYSFSGNYNQTYYIYVANNCGNDGRSAYTYAGSVTFPSLCPPIQNLTASNVTSNSVQLSWNRGEWGEETMWTIERYIVGNWDSPDNTTTVTDSTVTLNGLQPETNYSFRVQANCDATYSSIFSDWVNVTTFPAIDSCFPPTNINIYDITNSTATVSWEYVYGAVPESGWMMFYGTDQQFSDDTYTSISSISMGSPFVIGSLNDPLQPNTTYYVKMLSNCSTPMEHDASVWTDVYSFTTLDGPSCLEVTNLEVIGMDPDAAQITWTSHGNEEYWDLYWSTSPVAPTAQTNPTVGNTTNPRPWLAGLTPGTHYYAYVRARCSDADRSAWSAPLEFTTLEEIPSCRRVTNLEVIGMDPDAVQITWTSNGNEEYWDLYWTTSPEAPTAQTNPTVGNTNNPRPWLPELTPGTHYYAYVRARCSDADRSVWSDPLEFTIPCPVVTSFPWTENFDSYFVEHVYDRLPECWNYINTSSCAVTFPAICGMQQFSHSANNHLRLDSYIGSDPQDEYAILPRMQNINNLRIQLDARKHSDNIGGTVLVGVMTNPADASTFTTIGSLTPDSTIYEHYTFSFSDYTGSGEYIALLMRAADPINYSLAVCIDDIIVEELPIEPHSITINQVTGGTIYVNVVDNHGNAYSSTTDTIAAYNAWVNLSVEPNAGYTFDDFVVTTASEIPIEIINSGFVMPAEDVIVSATFTLNTYTVTATVDPENAGSVTGTGTYNYNDEVTLTATPATGYSFDHWQNMNIADNVDSETANPLSFNVTEDVTYKAFFSKVYYELVYMDGEELFETVTYNYGDIIDPMSAPEKEGYTFIGWNPAEPTTMPDHNDTLYAQWELIPCLAAENLTVANGSLTATSALITWNSSQNNTFGGVYYENGELAGSNNQLYQRWNLSALQPGTNYRVGVFAYCSLDRVSDTVWVEFNTNDTCYPPVSISISEVTAHSAKLSYAFVAQVPGDILVNLSTDPNFASCVHISTTTSSHPESLILNSYFNNAPLQPNTTYHVRMSSLCDRNADLTSVWSETLSFTTLQEYAVTIDANITNGTVTVSDTAAIEGAVVNLTATPNHGYSFGEWVVTTVNTPAPELVTVTNNSFVMPEDGVNVSATFIPNRYVITYKNGNNIQHQDSVAYGTAIRPITDPTREGYTFTGWVPELPATMPAYDVTVHAQWNINKYALTYMDGNDMLSQDSVEFGADITPVANPTKEGYTFNGWNPEVPSTMPAHDVTVTAIFTLNTYTVTATVNPANAGTVTGAGIYNYGSEVEMRAEAADGYLFSNWTNAQGAVVSTDAIFDFEIANDTAFTAHFTAMGVVATPTFSPAEGTYYDAVNVELECATSGATIHYTTDGSTPTASSAIYNGPIALTATSTTTINAIAMMENMTNSALASATYTVMPTYTVTIADNIVNGTVRANVTRAAEGVTVNLTAIADEGYHFAAWDVTTETGAVEVSANNSFAMPAGNVTISATFEANEHIITYMDGNTVLDVDTFTYGATITPIADPTREGYTFIGWFPELPATMPDNDVRATAQWSINRYALTYMDGNVILAQDSVDYGTPITPIADPTKEGYTFTGWNPQLPQTMPANDVTVNALWELIPCMAAENLAVTSGSLTATSALITWSSSQDNTFGGVYYENGVLAGSNNQLYQRWYLSELQPGTNYRVGVFAYCSLDRVSDTVWVEFTTNDTCYPPVSVSISDVTAHSALLSYDFGEHVPSDFMVHISTDPDFDEYDAVSTSTAPNYFPSSMPLSSLVGLNLQSGTTYYVRMASQCSTYLTSVWSETLSFTTLQEYAVTIDANIINGTVTADDTVATAGTVVNLTATPDNGYSFGEWIVTTVNTPVPEIVTVTNNSFVMPEGGVNVSATFTPNSYNITVNQVTGGTITIAEAGATAGSTTNTTAKYNAWVQLNAVADNGYTFSNFVVTNADGTAIETPNNGFIMPANDVTVTAIFNITPAELSWSAESFTGYTFIDFNNYKPTLNNPHNVSVRYGLAEDITNIVVNPETGYITNSFDVPSLITAGTFHIYAVHETDPTYYYDSVVYTLNVNWAALVGMTKSIEEGGNITFLNAVGNLTHAYSNNQIAYLAPGTSFTTTATANEGYHFVKWQIGNDNDGYTDYATTDTVVYTAPAEITSMYLNGMKAVFDTNTYVLNVVSNNNEMGSVNGGNPEAKHFLSYEISATPNAGYHFLQWNDGNTDNPRMVSLTEDATYEAFFGTADFELVYMNGEEIFETITYTYGETINPMSAPEREGYIFIGWAPAEPTTMPAHNDTLYAQWELIPCMAAENLAVASGSLTTTSALITWSSSQDNTFGGVYYENGVLAGSNNQLYQRWYLSELQPGTNYRVGVFAYCSLDRVSDTVWVEFTTNDTCYPPVSVSISDVTAHSALLSYDFGEHVPSDFMVHISTDPDFDEYDAVSTSTAPNYFPSSMPLSSLVGLNLQSGTTYYVRMASQCSTYLTSVWSETLSFTTLQEYAVTIDANIINGTVTADDTVATAGTVVNLTATPDNGYSFGEWIVTTVNTPAPEIVTVTNNSFVMPASEVNISATFTPNSYNITINQVTGGTITVTVSGATAGTTTNTTADFESWIQLSEVTEDGYTFVDFLVTDEDGEIIETPNNGFIMPASDVTVTALFSVNDYTVTYMDGNYMLAQDTFAFGATITPIDDPTREGYTFTGWSPALPTTMPANDLTVNAQWQINSYNVTVSQVAGGTFTVTINNAGVTTSTSTDTSANYNNWIQLSYTTYDGYTFNGFVVTTADGTFIETPNNGFVMPANDVTITANFTANDYTITYMDGNNMLAQDTFAFGATITPIANPTREGYTFIGWTPALPTTMPAEDLTVNAQWQINSYDITINQVTGGTITVSFAGESATSFISTTTDTAANFETWIQLSVVTDDGYNFVDFLVTTVSGDTLETPNNGFIMPAENVTVTAIFSINNYTITYMDGNNMLAQDTFAFGATITPIANPTREGYTFIGWTPALPTTMPAEDLTVNAQWQINSYDITINQVTGGTITVSFAGESATSFISTTTDTAANFETWIQLSVVTDDGYNFVDFLVTTVSGDTLETPNNGFIMPAENVTVTAIFSINNYTITYMDGNNMLAQDTFAFGATITPIANPTREGYTFMGWNPALPTTMPANDLTVDAQWQINSYDITINQVTGGTITVSFAGESATSFISTTTDTAANFETWIQLSADADYAYDFVDFVVTTASGDTLETPNNGFIMPAENVNVTAIFTLHYFNVTVNVSDETPWGTVTGGGSFVYGSTDTLTATANDQYIFVGWSDFNTDNPRVITVTSDSVLTAYFIPEDIEIISDDTLTGSVNVHIPGGHLSPTSPIVITAVPEPHYHFVSWSDGNTDNPRTILPIQAVGLTAIFAIDQHTVTVLSNDDNMGMVDGSATVDYGSVIQISATAHTGYTFISWNDGNTENPRYITVECDTTFIANFQLTDGIEDANMSNVNVYSYNDQVVIANAEGFSVEIFDMSGRLIVSENSISQSVCRYTITTDGIYLVKVGNNLFKKVKIAR